MSKEYRLSLAVFITLAVISAWILGVYRPLRKSQQYIKAYGVKVDSVREFDRVFDPVLDYYSPIGHDELVGAYLNVIVNILSQNPPPPPEVVRELVRKAEERSAGFMSKQSGFLFSQNVFKLGLIYKMAAAQFGLTEYRAKAVDTLEAGLRFSPDRPVFLFNLFELYYFNGDRAGVERLGKVILSRWPNEEGVRKALENLKK